MNFIDDFLGTEFGLLLIITIFVWGGFFLYLTYIFNRAQKLNKELQSIKVIDQSFDEIEQLKRSDEKLKLQQGD